MFGRACYAQLSNCMYQIVTQFILNFSACKDMLTDGTTSINIFTNIAHCMAQYYVQCATVQVGLGMLDCLCWSVHVGLFMLGCSCYTMSSKQ